ncbi:MAG: type ISP restriction/modification enzyme [Planctomycetota bacterium]
MPPPTNQYLTSVARTHAAGNATEHSYRPALKALVESFQQGITATNEPKRVQCGAPDFIVTRKNSTVGYIECKDIGEALDKVETSEQFKRYLDALQNLILTDYLQFRHYAAGKLVQEVTLARPDATGKIKALPDADEQLTNLFNVFLATVSTTIGTPKALAARMAAVAKVTREAIEKALALEDSSGTLHNELDSFRTTILPGMTEAEFADMYAQTVCYGLFSACANVPGNKARQFTREHAAYDLPATDPFLRDIFDYIAGTKLDANLVWAVDLLAEILRNADMGQILKDFGKATRREDPVVHFYETFLAAYDPKLRETRGVYYTPEPVVSYIVRSIDHILKTDFDCPTGLADNTTITARVPDARAKGETVEKEVHRVQILDPATGTGTFLFETARHIFDALKQNRGLWAGENGYAAKHLLPRLFGFELMIAPYAVAHMKLGWLLKETGYTFPKGDRLRIYLTNTLEEAETVSGPLLALAGEIAREANAASEVKTDHPIMVIMGNPPYSGHSANKNEWSRNLLRNRLPPPDGAPGYFECDGKPLGERNPKWLNDDYVKFIRFAQYRIERTGYGILGFITNHSYLNNPTFRGMRQSLMRTFDDIYVLDLHGGILKKETASDGSKDENVFDIMRGVAIAILVRRKSGRTKTPSTVRHADLFGLRKTKYAYLNEEDTSTTKWKKAKPSTPHYLFVPQPVERLKEYENGVSITHVMPVNSVGIVTSRDDLVFDFDEQALRRRVKDFIDPAHSDDEVRARNLSAADKLDVRTARDRLRKIRRMGESIVPCLYRPFDVRRLLYHDAVIERSRFDIMQHMTIGANVALVSARSNKSPTPDHFFCTRCVMETKCGESTTQSTLFPLYLYPNGDELIQASPWPAGKDGRRPNLSPQVVEELSSRLRLKFVSDGVGDRRKTFGPEDIFHYIYAIFHSPTYRTRYAEFLKIDFPRVPLTSDRKLFARLCDLGAELVGLHLLENVPTPRATYPIPGDNRVEKPHYKPPTDEAQGRVHVNSTQYFDDIPQDVWEFHVGGYQVCEKWLKDRRGRTLTYDDIETYRKITEAIRQTIRLTSAIDAFIPAWPLP